MFFIHLSHYQTHLRRLVQHSIFKAALNNRKNNGIQKEIQFLRLEEKNRNNQRCNTGKIMEKELMSPLLFCSGCHTLHCPSTISEHIHLFHQLMGTHRDCTKIREIQI